MRSITRQARYTYTLHDLSEFDLVVLETALENHAMKYPHLEGDIKVCNSILELIKETTSTN